ncbi:hypothetical protein [Streptomyces sp. NPDC058955]|uniref:hypothetical protein n=1 Tax=unclassified Streptomyces TaxID=2593676 RepID=UPI00365B82C6
MGVFAMFRRKRKGTAEDVAEVSAEAVATGTGVPEESDAAETVEVDGPVTRVPVAGVTAPARSAPKAPAEPADADATGSEAVSSTPVESAEDAPEEAGAVAVVVEVVEIPRQQSADTAADADTAAATDADSETGEGARR